MILPLLLSLALVAPACRAAPPPADTSQPAPTAATRAMVVTGHAVFTVDGTEVDAPAGTCVFLDDPAEHRGAVAREPGTVVLAVGGARGLPYAVSPWEFNFRATAAADVEEAASIVREGLERHPGNASLLYNLACYESRTGERVAALAHLREAVGAEPRYAEYAASDPDLDAVRGDPAFPAPPP